MWFQTHSRGYCAQCPSRGPALFLALFMEKESRTSVKRPILLPQLYLYGNPPPSSFGTGGLFMSAVQMDHAPSFVQSRTSDLHTTVHVTRHHSPIWPRRPGDHTFGRVGLIGRLLSGTKGAQNDASNKHEFQLPPTSLYQKQTQKKTTHMP